MATSGNQFEFELDFNGLDSNKDEDRVKVFRVREDLKRHAQELAGLIERKGEITVLLRYSGRDEYIDDLVRQLYQLRVNIKTCDQFLGWCPARGKVK